MDILMFPVGKIFHYQGRQWKKANLLLGQISRCVLCVEKDGGLFIDNSTRVDLEPGTQVSLAPPELVLPVPEIQTPAQVMPALRKPRKSKPKLIEPTEKEGL